MDYSLNRTADTLFITVNSSNCRYFECQKSFPCGSAGKESICNAGYLGSIPGLGRSPGEGKGYPLQYAGLENSMDYTIHGVAKSRTRLGGFHFLNFVTKGTILCCLIRSLASPRFQEVHLKALKKSKGCDYIFNTQRLPLG